jgi:AraC-like DNA-binding protein
MIIAYIENHCTDELSLPQLAKMSSLSVPHFIRLFKTVTGSTPMQYAMQRRIMLAERLFRQTDGNVTETALACGFTDSNHFTRMFRQYKGMSPRQYRNLFQH